MIEYRTGDILATDAEAVVIPTNCLGVMGAGLAKQARDKWPGLEVAYKEACAHMKPGRIWVWTHSWQDGMPVIICLPTKDRWKNPSRLEYVASGLACLAFAINDDRNINALDTIAIPPLGCGLGGLRWESVGPMIEAFGKRFGGHTILIYPPQGLAR